MTARLVARWPIHDQDCTQVELERIARADWPALVAEAGVFNTLDPVFQVEDAEPWPFLVGAADVVLGPIELRSHRLARLDGREGS